MMENNIISSKARNFKSIFASNISGIVIPIVQRDYAQGRRDAFAARIRERFLKVLYEALVLDKKVSLDFVYGSIDDGRMIPLDGQQRLTTLFLLHYYIARHECIDEKELEFLHRFSYETRVSSREFCSKLLDYTPSFDPDTLSEGIKDEAWFLMEWQNDPTVAAMLVMLDAIHLLFRETDNLWPKLMDDAITFFFLPLENMGMTDDLYIKMNSRGKPLTPFEHFKAEMELQVSKVDKELAHTIAERFDGTWTDMLWPLRDSGTGSVGADCVVDDEFLRLIHFVSDGICHKAHNGVVKDSFDIIHKLFSPQCPSAKENVGELMHFLDSWASVGDTNVFFEKYVTVGSTHVAGKIKRPEANLFAKCCASYGTRAFSLGDRLMLHAFTLYIANIDTISEDDFRRRIRIVGNLINNSSDNIRIAWQGEYLYEAFEKHVESIVLHGIVAYDESGARRNFNKNQVEEEQAKLAFTEQHPEMADLLFRLEDHPMLNGYIHAVGLEHLDWCDRFYSLFECHLRRVERALLSVGTRDFFVRDSWRYQLGTANPGYAGRIWREIFSPVRLDEDFCQRLRNLLSGYHTFSNDILETVIHNYMDNATTFPVRYYLVKYHDTMDYDCYGKYYWMEGESFDDYNLLMMMTEVSIGGKNYDVFLNTLYEKCKGEHPGIMLYDYSYNSYRNYGCDKLYTGNGFYITLVGSTYRVYNAEDTLVEERRIRQDEQQCDTEDRVTVGIDLLHKWAAAS